MKRKTYLELPPLSERCDVDRLGDSIVVRPRENGLVILAAADIRELRRVLSDPRGRKA